MKPDELLEVIKTLDLFIEMYALDVWKNNLKLFDDMKITTSIVNERTLSSFLTFKIKKALKWHGFRPSIAETELKIDVTSYKKIVKTGLEEEAGTRIDLKGSNVYVDSYFYIPRLFSGNGGHVFVEYKLDNKFVFIKLAKDFLKYKIYSYHNEKNSVFVYIIMKEQERYPTIVNRTGVDKYVVIPRKVSPDLFTKEDQIFIYLPTNEVEEENIEGIDLSDKHVNLYKKFDKIDRLTKDMSDQDFLKGEKLAASPFYQHINLFKPKVSTATILVDSFREIDELLTEVKSNPILKGTLKWYEEAFENYESREQAIKDISTYFFRFENHYSSAHKFSAYNQGMDANYRSSLFVIVILKVFAKVYGLHFNPTLPIRRLRGRERNIKDDNEISDRLADEKLSIYSFGQYKDNITDLAVGILYYLSNLYSLILIKREDGSFQFTDEYNNLKRINQIETLLEELFRELKVERIMASSESFRERTIDLFIKTVQLFE